MNVKTHLLYAVDKGLRDIRTEITGQHVLILVRDDCLNDFVRNQVSAGWSTDVDRDG